MLYFGCWEGGGGWEDACPKSSFSPLPQPPDGQGIRTLIDEGRGLHAETTQSALTASLKWFICGLTSVILIVLSTVTLQSRGQFVPISLRPILGIVAAYVMTTVWLSCS